VSRKSYFFRAFLTGMVCLLIPGVISLGAHAKAGQYESQKSVTGYLAKSTKMSDSRVQRGVEAPPEQVVMLLCSIDAQEPQTLTSEEPARLPVSPFLDSFRGRPPPNA
jgi:hypothetical protein